MKFYQENGRKFILFSRSCKITENNGGEFKFTFTDHKKTKAVF